MSSRFRILGALAASSWLVAAACIGDTTNGSGEAELLLLHVTPTLGPLDAYVGGTKVISGVSYGNTSSLVTVPGGLQRLMVRSGGQTLGALDHSLALQHVNSLVVAGGALQFSDAVTPDTGQVAGNRANVRMVNVVGSNVDAPTLLQVLVKAPNANPDSVMKFGMDARIASYGTLMYFDAGHFNFKYVPAGGTTVLAEVSFDVAAGEAKAVVLERAADGSYRVQVVVEH